MDSASQIILPDRTGINRLASNTGVFQPGSILTIRILELNGNRALIDFGAGRTLADIKIPVTVGEELLVKVQQSAAQPNLELISSNPKTPSGDNTVVLQTPTIDLESRSIIQSDLKRLLVQFLAPDKITGVSGNLRRAMELLSAYFESVDPEKPTTEIPSRLMAYANNSGVFFEKLLETAIQHIRHVPNSTVPGQLSRHPEVQTILNRDLKAILYMFKNVVDDDPSFQRALESGSSGILRKNLELLLGDITRQQGRAVRLSDSAEPFQMFSFCIPLTQDRKPAKLKLYYPRKQKAGLQQGFQISLLLAMDRLGNIRTDLYLLERDLSVTFFVKDQTARSRILKYQTDLQHLLNPFFNQTLLRVVISEKKIDDFEQEDAQIANDRRVDLRI